MVKYLKELNIIYEIIPFKRNQDVIRVFRKKQDYQCAVSVVDGWNNLKFTENDIAGRQVAKVVADQFPDLFIKTEGRTLRDKATKAARLMDEQVLDLYPAHTSCVGIFLFEIGKTYLIIAVGSVVVFLWSGREWFKPKEIKDYSLDLKIYPSDVSRFFGLGELKKLDPKLYSCDPDVIEIKNTKQVFLASDGFEDVFDLKSFNNFTYRLKNKSSKYFIESLSREIQKSQSQKDDISILIKGNLY